MMDRLSAHLGYQFTEHPLADRFAAAARAGFSAVEHPTPFPIPAPVLAGMLRRFGLTLVQMSTAVGDPARGEKGLACLPDRIDELRATIAPGIAYAKAVDCRLLHVMAGVRPSGADPARLWATYLDNIRFAADQAAPHGLTILIEPIGPATIADYFLDHPDRALQALQEIGRPNVKLLLDVFHAAYCGLDVVELVTAHHAAIAHVQIADLPGRHEPGTGDLPFDRLFATLDAVGYAGHIGCEYHPAAGTEAGLVWRDRYRQGRSRSA